MSKPFNKIQMFLLTVLLLVISCARSKETQTNACCCEFQQGQTLSHALTDENTCVGERPGGQCVARQACP